MIRVTLVEDDDYIVSFSPCPENGETMDMVVFIKHDPVPVAVVHVPITAFKEMLVDYGEK